MDWGWRMATTTTCFDPPRRCVAGEDRADDAGEDRSSISRLSEPNLSGTSKVRVLLADDDVVVREAYEQILNKNARIQVVSVASNGHEALRNAVQTNPDVAVLDWFMPRLNGYEAARAMAEAGSCARTIITTGYPKDVFAYQAVRAGILGYLPKQLGIIELVDAVLAVSQGSLYVRSSPVVGSPVGLKREAVFGPENSALTSREREVLRFVAWGFSTRDIARELGLSEKTIARHREKIMRKLNIHDVAGLTLYAVRIGLVSV